MLLEINKTGEINKNHHCLARKMVILKSLKKVLEFVSGTPAVLALEGKFVSSVHCRRQIKEKMVDKGK